MSTIVSAPCSRAIADQLLDRIANAGRRLGVDHADDVGAFAAQLVAQPLRIDRPPPLDVDAPDACAVALEDLRQAIAEVAGHDDDAAHAVGDDVGDGSFHRRRTGAGRRQRQRLVVGPEHATQRRTHFVEQRHEIGIEVTEHRRRHRAQHAGRNEARAGAKKNAFGIRKGIYWYILAVLRAGRPLVGPQHRRERAVVNPNTFS